MADQAPARAQGMLQSTGLTVLLCALSGGLAGLGQVPFSLLPLSLAGFAGIAALMLLAPTRRGAFFRGWMAGSGYFAVTLHWITEPFQIDADLHGWIAPFALFFLATGLALFWGGAGFLAQWLAPRHGARKAVAIVAALGLAELSRAYLFTGFPWAIPAYIWTELPQRGWASVIGSHGVTVLTLALTASVALAALHTRRRAVAALVAAALGIAVFAVGPVLLSPPAAPGADRPIVRLVQPNAPQDEKWDPELAAGFVRRQIAFTAAPTERQPDLIVWPETAIPYLLHRAGPVLDAIGEAADGTPVILGVQRLDKAGYRNALAVLGPGGQPVQTYDKHHLVPFGEYMPFPALFRATGIRGIAERADGGYVPGPGPELLDLGALGTALPLICYEAIFPQDVLGAPERPDLLIQITNDAWFGEFAGPQQHLAQARMRAVEMNLPMIRVANTGVSAMIDGGGRVIGAIPLGEAGFRDLALPEAGAPTIYAQTGDWALFVFLLATLGAIAASHRVKRH